MVNIKLKYNFVETARKFIIAELSIRIESFAIINLRAVSTKLYFNFYPQFVFVRGNVRLFLPKCLLFKNQTESFKIYTSKFVSITI